MLTDLVDGVESNFGAFASDEGDSLGKKRVHSQAKHTILHQPGFQPLDGRNGRKQTGEHVKLGGINGCLTTRKGFSFPGAKNNTAGICLWTIRGGRPDNGRQAAGA